MDLPWVRQKKSVFYKITNGRSSDFMSYEECLIPAYRQSRHRTHRTVSIWDIFQNAVKLAILGSLLKMSDIWLDAGIHLQKMNSHRHSFIYKQYGHIYLQLDEFCVSIVCRQG